MTQLITTDLSSELGSSIEDLTFPEVQPQYVPIVPASESRLWSQELGFYLGIKNRRLRLFSANGSIVLFPEEAQADRANQAEHRASQAETQLQRERERMTILMAKLLELGIDPNELT